MDSGRAISIAVIVAVAAAAAVAPASGAPRDVREALKQRYRVSQIEVQNTTTAGTVVRPGVILRLEADGVPAKRFRVTQINTKSPRFHVRDYSRVEIDGDRMIGRDGLVTLARGTRLVLLDLKVEADRVHMFTHSADPVGSGGYGCTEFVFRFDPDVIQRADVATIERVIGRWLARAT